MIVVCSSSFLAFRVGEGLRIHSTFSLCTTFLACQATAEVRFNVVLFLKTIQTSESFVTGSGEEQQERK